MFMMQCNTEKGDGSFMAKFAFFNIPLHAHINPTLPVVKELVARGDEVTYYLTDKYKDAIEATGATFHSYHSKLEHSAAHAHDQNRSLSMQMVDECLSVMPQVLESVRKEQPDCIVYDPMCLSGRLLAHILDIPAVISRPIFVAHEQGRRKSFRSRGIEQEDMRHFEESMERLCKLYPVQSFDVMSMFTHKEDLNIIYIPRSFQMQGESLGEEYRFVGPSIGPRCESSTFPFEQLSKRPVVYITLGTVYNYSPDFFKTCFAAFANQPWQIVIATGRPLEQLHLGPIPANVMVCSYVPQLEVLQRTAVMISHGSMTTVMEAISRGVPMVVIPQASSQETSARRVAELGLGIALEKDKVTAESLRDAVQQIMRDPHFSIRAQQMQEEASESGGFQSAADALQSFAKKIA